MRAKEEEIKKEEGEGGGLLANGDQKIGKIRNMRMAIFAMMLPMDSTVLR